MPSRPGLFTAQTTPGVEAVPARLMQTARADLTLRPLSVLETSAQLGNALTSLSQESSTGPCPGRCCRVHTAWVSPKLRRRCFPPSVWDGSACALFDGSASKVIIFKPEI